MNALTLDVLDDRLADAEWAAIRVSGSYQPTGGPGSRVYPPSFPIQGEKKEPYLYEDRTYDRETRRAVILDQVPSQANRCEEAILTAWRSGRLKMPMLHLIHQGSAHFEVFGLTAPHRAFDAYWRDSLLDGEKFDKTDIGKAIQKASLEDAIGLLQYDPGTLVYGGWNSHRKGWQVKFPRLYSSELIGWDPTLGVRKAGRMDPANLTGSRKGDGDEWTFSTAAPKSKSKLSEIGHGNIAPNAAHGGVTVTEVTRSAVISLTAARRIRFGELAPETQRAARVFLVAFALMGDRLAFGNAGMWLRSGCDLVEKSETLEFVGRGGRTCEFTLTPDAAVALYHEAVSAASDAGVPVKLDTIDVRPNKALADAIDFALTKAEPSGE